MKKNFNINIEGTTTEEVFRHSPSKDIEMLEAVFAMFNALMVDAKGKNESKKQYHRRKGYALGITGMLSLLTVDRTNLRASPALFTKLLLEYVETEKVLKSYLSASVSVMDGTFPFYAKDIKKRPTKDQPVKVMMYNSKTKKTEEKSVSDLPSEVIDALRKISEGK